MRVKVPRSPVSVPVRLRTSGGVTSTVRLPCICARASSTSNHVSGPTVRLRSETDRMRSRAGSRSVALGRSPSAIGPASATPAISSSSAAPGPRAGITMVPSRTSRLPRKIGRARVPVRRSAPRAATGCSSSKAMGRMPSSAMSRSSSGAPWSSGSRIVPLARPQPSLRTAASTISMRGPSKRAERDPSSKVLPSRSTSTDTPDTAAVPRSAGASSEPDTLTSPCRSPRRPLTPSGASGRKAASGKRSARSSACSAADASKLARSGRKESVTGSVAEASNSPPGSAIVPWSPRPRPPSV